jgi:hypothetical protein
MHMRYLLGAHLLLRLQDDLITKPLKPPHSGLLYPLLVQRLKVGGPKIVIRLLVSKEVVDDNDDAV